MKTPRLLSWFLPLTCAFLVTSAQAANTNAANDHARLSGVYLSGLRAGPSMNLSLGTDGTATVTEDAGEGARTLFGHWAESGNQVTVTFAGRPAEPPMVFAPAHDGLQAVSWNHASWGKVDPPPMKKGYKVKQLYWLTTGP